MAMEDEVDRFGQVLDLILQPAHLLAIGQEIGIAVEINQIDPGTELDRIPPAALQLGECIPPVFQALIGIAHQFVVP